MKSFGVRLLLALVIVGFLILSEITRSNSALTVHAAETQRVMFKFTNLKATYDMTDSTFNSAIPNLPSNWSTPVDYKGGNIYYKMTVHNKPTDMTVIDQLCMYQNNNLSATCSSPPNDPYTTNGTFYRKLPDMSTWWTAGGFDINKPINVMKLVHKDAQWNPYWYEQCGTQCYTGPLDLHQHMPYYYDIEAIMVANGAQLAYPADWSDCPASVCGTPTITIPPIQTSPTDTPHVQATNPPSPSPTFTPAPTMTQTPGCATKSQGDANCNGKPDLVDYEIWRREYIGDGTNSCSLQNLTTAACQDDADHDGSIMDADFNGDGKVTLADYQIWKNVYSTQ